MPTNQEAPSQVPDNYCERVIDTTHTSKAALKYSPLKQDDDLASNQDAAAEKCLTEFLGKGGSFQYTVLEAFQPKIHLLPDDAIYPVCSGGLCRSQTLWAILEPFSSQLVLFPPHAARHGFDPYNGQINRQRNYLQEIAYDEFSLYFAMDKSLRFGFEHALEWEAIKRNSTKNELAQISEFYQQHYFGPDSSWQGRKGKRRIYTVFSSNTHVVLYRLNQANANLHNVTVIAIDSEDIITHSPDTLQTAPRSAKAYEHFAKKLHNLFELDFV